MRNNHPKLGKLSVSREAAMAFIKTEKSMAEALTQHAFELPERHKTFLHIGCAEVVIETQDGVTRVELSQPCEVTRQDGLVVARTEHKVAVWLA